MSKEVTITASNLPAHLQEALTPEVFKEFSGGVQSGFPIISYRGRTWRVRKSGDEQVYLNEEGDAVQSIEVVFIQSSERLSKTYYEGKYQEGDSSKPQCWSANGVTPDADVPNPVNAACASCPMNQWGSRITEQGNKTRACQDVRRCAVAFAHELEQVNDGEREVEDLNTMLLRIPPASLNPLKDYVEKVLKPKGLPPFVLVTKVGFDTEVSFPKLTFKAARFLAEAEFGAVSELRDSDSVRRILDTSAEHVTEGSTGNDDEAESSEVPTKSEASEPAPSEAFSEPVESEDEIAPPPTPKRAAAVEEEAADEQPPKPSKKKAKTVVKKKAKAESPSEASDIDDMLASILD